MENKSCLTCAHKERCLLRSLTIFLLYIKNNRLEEAEHAQQNMDVSADCNSWEAKE